MMKRPPKVIFAAWRDDSVNDPPYLVAETTRAALAQDDEKVIVGTYQLVETHELTKVVQEKKKR